MKRLCGNLLTHDCLYFSKCYRSAGPASPICGSTIQNPGIRGSKLQDPATHTLCPHSGGFRVLPVAYQISVPNLSTKSQYQISLQNLSTKSHYKISVPNFHTNFTTKISRTTPHGLSRTLTARFGSWQEKLLHACWDGLLQRRLEDLSSQATADPMCRTPLLQSMAVV